MKTHEFAENRAGVHLMMPGLEYSFCGDAIDSGSSGDNEEGDLEPTNKTNLTCPICIRMVLYCKGVKIKK